jgi:uncharacterized protein YycO
MGLDRRADAILIPRLRKASYVGCKRFEAPNYMKQSFVLPALFISFAFLHLTNNAVSQTSRRNQYNSLRDGDIIFHTSRSNQSQAIQQATKSKYSHCGILLKKGNDHFVLEAVEPVKLTPLKTWISRGKNGHFVVKRLKNADSILTTAAVYKLTVAGNKFLGKHYDIYFDWSDDKLYCSELIWKVYKNALNIEIGELELLKNFNLSSPLVKKILKQRYGNSVPLNQIVISPESIFNSKVLETVTKDGKF